MTTPSNLEIYGIFTDLEDLKLEYGVYDITHNSYLTREHGRLYDFLYKQRHAVVQPPHLLEKNRIGSCYDTARWLYHKLHERYNNIHFVYMEFHHEGEQQSDTHTTVIVEDPFNVELPYIWVEYTWLAYRGIWSYATLEEAHNAIQLYSRDSGSFIDYYNSDVSMTYIDAVSCIRYPAWYSRMNARAH